jgi:integrase
MQFNQKDIEKLISEHHFFGFLREWTLQYRSIQNLAWRMIERERHSFHTFRRYVTGIKDFVNYLGVENPDQAVEKVKEGDATKIVDGFIGKLTKDGVKPITIKSTYYGVRKWLMSNNVKAEWQFIARPKAVSKIKDRIPTIEELRKILSFAHIRDKALFMTMLSSGLRVGTAINLKVKEYERFQDLAIIHVEGGEGKKLSEGMWYWTFITPEARKIVDAYLEWREHIGEKLTPESPLFSAVEKNTAFKFATNASRQWRRLVEKASLDKILAYTGWLDIHLHTLRKFFHTKCKGAGITRDYYDFWMGHSQGLDLADSYWREEIGKHLEEYRKAIPQLSIFEVPAITKEDVRKTVAETIPDEALKPIAEKLGMTIEQIRVRMAHGVLEEETEEIGDQYDLGRETLQPIKRKKQHSTAAEEDCQKVVSETELQTWLSKGWHVVSVLKSGKVVISNE